MKTPFKIGFIAAAALALSVGVAGAQSGTFPGKTEQPWFMQAKLASNISVSGTSGATLLPTPGFVAWICNIGSNDAYLNFGTANTKLATVAGGTWLKAGTCNNYDLFPALGIPGPYTYVAAITASSTTTLYVETGVGNGPPQPGTATVSGTVTANQGAPNTAANAWPVNLTPTAVTYTDRSGTITTGGTAQQIAAANSSRHGMIIQNVSTGDEWFSSVTTAVASQPSIWLPAGSYYEFPINGVPSTAISMIGATTGQAFSAREW